jgi:hypothetical protein
LHAGGGRFFSKKTSGAAINVLVGAVTIRTKSLSMGNVPVRAKELTTAYKLAEVLGEGGYGVVRRAIRIEDVRTVPPSFDAVCCFKIW